MVPAMPPVPPAIVRSVVASPSSYGQPMEKTGPTSVLEALATMLQLPTQAPRPSYGVGFKMGPKTKGKRDASRKSRANRRKR